ncbi:MAG: hypothetical protein ACE5IQ_10330 [Candidatus Methylomirabilales bacterium]
MKHLTFNIKAQIAFYGTGLFIAVTIIALRYEKIPSAWIVLSLWALGVAIVGLSALGAGLAAVRIVEVKVPQEGATVEERVAWRTEVDKLIVIVCMVLISVCLFSLVGWYMR